MRTDIGTMTDHVYPLRVGNYVCVVVKIDRRPHPFYAQDGKNMPPVDVVTLRILECSDTAGKLAPGMCVFRVLDHSNPVAVLELQQLLCATRCAEGLHEAVTRHVRIIAHTINTRAGCEVLRVVFKPVDDIEVQP